MKNFSPKEKFNLFVSELKELGDKYEIEIVLNITSADNSTFRCSGDGCIWNNNGTCEKNGLVLELIDECVLYD
jgi:hypothetical protein